MARKILILFAHPALERSRVNRRLFEAASAREGVTAHDLYETYPRQIIDVKREQELCEAHDVLLFQHPLYWYSTPALLKEWFDLVLELGWAYGPEGNALRGKIMLNAITTGGSAEAYHEQGRNRFTMRELLAPVDQTAHLCGMQYLAPFVVHGALSLTGRTTVAPHVERYVRLIDALRDDELDLERARQAQELSSLLDELPAYPRHDQAQPSGATVPTHAPWSSPPSGQPRRDARSP